MKLGIRELLFFGVILGLMACSYLVLQKKAQERHAFEADTAAKQRELDELSLATVGIDDMRVRINELEGAIKHFDEMLPKQKDVQVILDLLSKTAESHRLRSKTVKTLKSERFAGYSEQPIQMSLSGDFNGFYAFLLELEKFQRVTRLTQMKLEKIQEHDGEMQAQMTLSVFFVPDVEVMKVAGAQ